MLLRLCCWAVFLYISGADELKSTIASALTLSNAEILTCSDLGFSRLANGKVEKNDFLCSLTGVKITEQNAITAKVTINEILSGNIQKIRPSHLFPKGHLFKRRAIENKMDPSHDFAFAFLCLTFSNYWKRRGNRKDNLTSIRTIFDIKTVDTVKKRFYQLIYTLIGINNYPKRHVGINLILDKCCNPFNKWFDRISLYRRNY